MKNVKKTLLLSVFMLGLLVVHAQDKKFSIGVGGGMSVATNKPSNSVFFNANANGIGFGFFANFMYNITGNLSVGLEYNGNLVLLAFDENDDDVEVTVINGYLPKVRYRFGEDGTRFFVGAMTGFYNIKPGSTDGINFLNYPNRVVFGVAPEIGVQFGNSFQLATSLHLPSRYNSNGLGFLYRLWQFSIGWNINFVDN